MSRTTKWEHKTDSWHENNRMERKARPAGLLKRIVEQEQEHDRDDDAER